MSTDKRSAGTINVTKPQDGDDNPTWKAVQVAVDDIPQKGSGSSRKDVDVKYGPLINKGYFDKDDLTAEIAITILGISLGVVKGNLNDGFTVEVELLRAKGSQKFYLRKGNDPWTHIDLKLDFNGHYSIDLPLEKW